MLVVFLFTSIISSLSGYVLSMLDDKILKIKILSSVIVLSLFMSSVGVGLSTIDRNFCNQEVLYTKMYVIGTKDITSIIKFEDGQRYLYLPRDSANILIKCSDIELRETVPSFKHEFLIQHKIRLTNKYSFFPKVDKIEFEEYILQKK